MIIPLTEGDKKFYTYPELTAEFPNCWVLLAPCDRKGAIGGVLRAAADDQVDVDKLYELARGYIEECGEDKPMVYFTFVSDSNVPGSVLRRGIMDERRAQMTEEERRVLYEWFFDRNSICGNHTTPVFSDIYRYEEEIRTALENLVVLKRLDAFEKLAAKGREGGLAERQVKSKLNAVSEALRTASGQAVDTIYALEISLREAQSCLNDWEDILREHGLLQEVHELMALRRDSTGRDPGNVGDISGCGRER
jgi:hypothetical protein